MKKIRVLIADDHTLVREGLRALLESQSDLEIVAEASNGLEAVQRCNQLKPDVALMDIGMPEMDGFEATRKIAKAHPTVRVLVLTVHETDDYFFRALEAGAQGFVVKDAASTDLVAAVRAVHDGGVFLHPPLAKRMVEDYLTRVSSGEERSTYETLTPREREVLELVGQGYTNQEMANLLTLSINTIQTHRSRIMDKLDLHSRAELMKYAVRMGLHRDRTP